MNYGNDQYWAGIMRMDGNKALGSPQAECRALGGEGKPRFPVIKCSEMRLADTHIVRKQQNISEG